MTNQEIENTLHKHFVIEGSYTIHKGLVNVSGNVEGLVTKTQGVLPVQFGEVSGNFQLTHTKYKTLIGCPHTVGGDMYLGLMDDLEKLTGMPQTIYGDCHIHAANLKTFKDLSCTIHGTLYAFNGWYHDLDFESCNVKKIRCRLLPILSVETFLCLIRNKTKIDADMRVGLHDAMNEYAETDNWLCIQAAIRNYPEYQAALAAPPLTPDCDFSL